MGITLESLPQPLLLLLNFLLELLGLLLPLLANPPLNLNLLLLKLLSRLLLLFFALLE